MKRLLPILLALSVASCSICKHKPVIEYRDSVRVEYRDRIIHDTINYEIPVEVEKNVTRDTASHLENRLAASDAVVSGGFLHHSLRTKAQTIYIPIETHVTDTIVVQKQAEIITKEVKVERPLKPWQRFKIGAFWWLLGLAAAGWRKELLWLIRKAAGLFI